MKKNGKKLLSHTRVPSSNTLASKRSTATRKRSVLGRYIVADPKICHGKPTFRGTRIMVADVLEMVSSGMAWETIVEEWNGHITSEAIAEAVNLARQAFLKHAIKHVTESIAA